VTIDAIGLAPSTTTRRRTDLDYYTPRRRSPKNNMDDNEINNEFRHGNGSGSIGQLSFAPATRTTVVTTTTTTTTTFPPLFIKPPRAIRELDPKLYPLASSPTPSALRNIKFDLGGKSVVFKEPDDTAATIDEVRDTCYYPSPCRGAHDLRTNLSLLANREERCFKGS
jgi:hypothetical protein